MYKKLSLVLLVALTVATTGRADVFITTSETANQGVVGGSGSVDNVIRATGTNLGGYLFANDVTSSTPTAGDIVNLVQMDNITAFNQSNGNQTKSNSPSFVTVVTATQAKIVSVGVGGSVNTQILSAVAGVYTTPTLNVQHPNTWATDPTKPLATYSLATPVNVIPGFAKDGNPAEGDIFLASQLNQSSVNLTTPQLSQSVALFKEVNNGGFLVVDGNPAGQLGIINEELNAGTLPTLSSADQTALNSFFNTLENGVSPFGFANFGGGGVTDFTPTQGGGSGDAEFTFSLNVDPGVFLATVPEPATLSLWGLLLGAGGIGGLVRRYRSRTAKKA